MHQLQIKEAEKPGLAALSADAETAGDLKDVASLVYPDIARKDPEKARNKLSDGLRRNHQQKLDIDEAIEIIVAAVSKNHRSSLLEHIISRLPKNSCEFKWLTKQEKMERVTATLSEMLPQFVDVLQQAQALINGERK